MEFDKVLLHREILKAGHIFTWSHSQPCLMFYGMPEVV